MIDKRKIGLYTDSVSNRYPIRAASRLTGLSTDTLRAWERRYQVVTPERSDRGRLYSDEQVQRLLKLKRALEQGHAIGQIATLSDTELDRLFEVEPQPASSSRSRDKLDQPIDSAIQAIQRYDFASAEKTLTDFATILDPPEFVEKVVLPFMRLVGKRWHKGSYSVAQEHMASSIIRNLLGSVLRTRSNAHPPGHRILIAAPAGELHEFGILGAALLASSFSYNLIYLGANLPGRDVVDAAERSDSRIVLLGLSSPEPDPAILDEVRLVVNNLSASRALWLGGPSSISIAREFARPGLTPIEDFVTLRNILSKGGRSEL